MILNFKQLAEGLKNKDGKVIKNNTLMRSAYIVPNDINYKFLIDKNINTILDFRSKHEIDHEPNFSNIDVLYYPLGKNKNEEKMRSNMIKFQVSDMVEFYKQGIQECEYLKLAIRNVVINPRNILFHCTAGKDRTGMFGCILMLLLNFDLDSCREHYLDLDPLFIENTREKIKAYMPEVDDQELDDILSVKQEYFNAFIDGIIMQYGEIDNYLESFELTKDQVDKFRAFYLI